MEGKPSEKTMEGFKREGAPSKPTSIIPPPCVGEHKNHCFCQDFGALCCQCGFHKGDIPGDDCVNC